MARSVSVVIATAGRPERLPSLLDDVVGQLGPDDDVWVVDQSTTAAARAGESAVALTGDPRVRWRWRSRRGLPGARNQGVCSSSGEVVWFIDDDVRLHDGALEAHRRAYDDPTVGGVVGRILELRLASNASGLVNRVDRGGRVRCNLQGTTPGEVHTLKGANMSYRRRALAQAGPFDERYRGTSLLEDADLSTRVAALGWRLLFVPEAAVDHHHDPHGGVRVADERERLAWRFRNTAYYLRRHRGWGALGPMLATQAAVAMKHVVTLRAPGALPTWSAALRRGWTDGAEPALQPTRGDLG